MKETFKKSLRIIGKIFKWILIVLVVVFVLIFAVWKIPAVHNFAVKQATSYFNEKTGGTLSVGEVDLRLPFYIGLENIGLESPEGNQMASIQQLEIYPGWRMLFNKTIRVDEFNLDGTQAKIFLNKNGKWNFDFIIEGFSDTTAQTAPKDTSSGGWDFSLGDLNINQLDFIYADRTTGDSVDVDLGKLELDMEELNLEENRYLVEELVLQNNEIFLRFAATSENSESEESTSLPDLGLDQLEIENTELTLFLGDEIPYRFNVGRLLAESENIDLNQNRYHLEQFGLYQTAIGIPLSSDESNETTEEGNEETSIFAPIDAALGKVELEGIELNAYTSEDTLHSLRGVSIDAEDLKANSQIYALELNRLSLDYNEFDELQELHGSFELKPSASSVQDLVLRYGESKIDLNAEITYSDFNALMENFEFRRVDLDLKEAYLARSDIRNAYRRLDMDTLPLPRDDLKLKLKAEGDFEDVTLSSFQFKTGGTRMNLTARSQGDSIWPRSVDLPNLKLNIYRPDLVPFTDYLGVDTSMIPRDTRVSLSAKYLARSMNVDADIFTNFGDLFLEASGNGYAADKQSLQLELNSPDLRIGDYLGMQEPLRTDIQFTAEGEDVMSDDRIICSALNIDTLNYASYGYNNLKLKADLFGDEIIYNFSVADTFLNAVLAGRLEYGDSLEAVVSGSINGVDLQGLNYAEKDIRGGFDIYAYYRQDSLITDAFVQLADILFVKEGDRFPLEPVTASFYDCPDSTATRLNSGFAELNSVANRSFAKIGELITNSLSREENRALADTGAYWNADLTVKNVDDIKALFLPQLEEFKSSTAELKFSAKSNELTANAVFPGIRYGNFILDSLSLKTQSIEGNVERNLHIDRLAYDSLGLTELDVNLDRTPKGAEFNLTINPDTSTNHYRIAANLDADSTRLTEGFNIHFNDSLILNGEKWGYDEACCVRSNQEGISFEYFEFFRKNSSFRLDKAGNTSPTVLSAENFPIQTVTGMIDTEQSLLTGEVNGELTLNQDGSFTGNGNINDFGVSGAPFGKLTWDASKENGRFRTKIRNQGDLVDFTLDGNITPETDTTSTLDLDFNLEKFDLRALEEIMAEQISESSGILSGNITIDGSSSDPQFEGKFSFANVALKPAGSEAKYFVDGQTLSVTPEKIDLNGFTIRDKNRSKLRLGGKIEHDNFTKPRLDVTVKAEDFMLVDIKDGAGLGLYGKLVADLDLDITGKIAAPRVKADIRINKPTDFSYLVSESADREAFDETLLVWKNFEEETENAILTRTKEKAGSGGNIFANNPKITGNLNIDKSAIFRVVIDSSAGDYLQIQGSAKLSIDYDRTGALRFNGIYEVSEGFYQMTFYDIVKRKFEFKEGSQIIWNGEPTNANIDITAVYRTRAGIANLMLTDPSASYDQSFQQQLPFLVLMDIQGELMDPEIFFDIQLAEGSEGALSGSVQARLRDLTENENRLNKQVFALLVLGSFLPQSGASDANILSNQARNSASQILTNQLNTLSDKYIKGVDINFDLYSYGGAAGQGNTDLNINLAKSFADDRVIVKVGSTIALEEQNSTAAQATQQQFLTNIEVEYKLTPDGRYRLIVFSKTDLEDIVIGRITRSGGGFVFQRDFDRFRHLFDPPKDEEDESLFDEEDTGEDEEEEPKSEDE